MSKMRWNPETGEPVVFGDHETPPANFLPCHPDDPDRARKVPPPAKAAPTEPDGFPAAPPKQDSDRAGMTKAEVMDALRSGGIEFDQAASKAALTDILIDALRKALTAKNIVFDENDTAKALLDKLTAPAENSTGE